jgi:DNA-binding FrmR family transcriptional regulator
MLSIPYWGILSRGGVVTVKKKKTQFKDYPHPDHSGVLPRLNRVQGQITGIAEMIHNRRYCVDILTQLKASRSALKSIEHLILKNHLQHCVAEVFSNKNAGAAEAKIDEIIQLLTKET